MSPVSLPLVRPPDHRQEPRPDKPDPYLASETELKGRRFDDPFWYPAHRHIVKGYRNKDSAANRSIGYTTGFHNHGEGPY